MPSKCGPLTYITLADDRHEPLGAVAYGGDGWTLTCGQCPYACPSTDPGTAVTELLAHIDDAHGVAPLVEVVDRRAATWDGWMWLK